MRGAGIISLSVQFFLGGSIGYEIPVDIQGVNAPFPLYVTVMSTGFHSLRDSSQGISKLMLYRLSRRNMQSGEWNEGV